MRVGRSAPGPQPKPDRLPRKVAMAVIATVITLGGGAAIVGSACGCLAPGAQDPSPGGGSDAFANIWIDGDGGTCTDSPTLVPYSDAAACGTFDAANDTCDNGDLVYVKTTGSYSGENWSGSNSRTSTCTIAPEPATGDIIFTSDFALGTDGGNGPDWLTFESVQCGTDNTSFTNNVSPTIWDDSNDLVFDDLDCPEMDIFGGKRITILNSDFGPCGSNSSPLRVCIPRVGPGSSAGIAEDITYQDTNFHDMWCGTGSAVECAANHTDGLAIFGSDGVTLRRVKFWKNDITNIRFQNNTTTSDPNTNVTIENSWFGAPCATTSGTNCTGGLNANGFDVDDEMANLILRFSSFQQDTRPQCQGPGSSGSNCGTAGSPALFLGNIYSTNASFCGYGNVTRSYNAENHWNGSGDSVCSGTGNNMSASAPGYVTGTGVVDFHISTPGNEAGRVTSGCISTDIDGDARTSTCDAGADES